MEDRMERVYCHSVVADMDDMPAKKTFAEIVAKDSGDRSFGFSSDVLSMLCLDLDAIESLRSGDNEKTMDCSVGIGRYNVTQRVFCRQEATACRIETQLCESYFGRFSLHRESEAYQRSACRQEHTWIPYFPVYRPSKGQGPA